MKPSYATPRLLTALFFVLACLASTAAIAHPCLTPDLYFSWVPQEEEGREIKELSECRSGKCEPVDLASVKITGRKPADGTDTRMEVEVCKEKNPWRDVCDVYSCKEDWGTMQSICTFRYSYNKDCMTETCTGT